MMRLGTYSHPELLATHRVGPNEFCEPAWSHRCLGLDQGQSPGACRLPEFCLNLTVGCVRTSFVQVLEGAWE